MMEGGSYMDQQISYMTLIGMHERHSTTCTYMYMYVCVYMNVCVRGSSV